MVVGETHHFRKPPYRFNITSRKKPSTDSPWDVLHISTKTVHLIEGKGGSPQKMGDVLIGVCPHNFHQTWIHVWKFYERLIFGPGLRVSIWRSLIVPDSYWDHFSKKHPKCCHRIVAFPTLSKSSVDCWFSRLSSDTAPTSPTNFGPFGGGERELHGFNLFGKVLRMLRCNRNVMNFECLNSEGCASKISGSFAYLWWLVDAYGI